MKKRWIVLMIVLAILLAIGIAMSVFMKKAEAALEQLSGIQIVEPNLATIADGNYEGSFSSFPVKVVVAVTVKDRRIADIRLLEHVQGKGKDAEVLLPRIVETQRIGLDAITGATYSSIVIMKAVEQALSP